MENQKDAWGECREQGVLTHETVGKLKMFLLKHLGCCTQNKTYSLYCRVDILRKGNSQLLEGIKKLDRPVRGTMVSLLGVIDLGNTKVWLREDEALAEGGRKLELKSPL